MKYAKIEDNVVKVISYKPVDGWEEVSDDVYADMVKKKMEHLITQNNLKQIIKV